MKKSEKAVSLTHSPRRRLCLSCFYPPCLRLRDRRGETLAETLVSLLIMVSALMILAGGITTGARINKEADTKYSIVFPPPMDGKDAHFTYIDKYNEETHSFGSPVEVRLDVSDAALAENRALAELKNRRLSSETESAAAVVPSSRNGAFSMNGAFTVRVRKALTLDRNTKEPTWRILYVFEDVTENAPAT